MPLAWHCGHFFFYGSYEEEIDNYSSFGYLTCCILYLMWNETKWCRYIDPVKVEEYTAVLENSVDLDSIAGTYCGVLPPNVETILMLNADSTYRLKRKSANESDSCEVLNGIFKVIDGSILMLEHPSSSDNIFYKVKNDSGIILIDSFGNEPKARDSKLYILKK